MIVWQSARINVIKDKSGVQLWFSNLNASSWVEHMPHHKKLPEAQLKTPVQYRQWCLWAFVLCDQKHAALLFATESNRRKAVQLHSYLSNLTLNTDEEVAEITVNIVKVKKVKIRGEKYCYGWRDLAHFVGRKPGRRKQKIDDKQLNMMFYPFFVRNDDYFTSCL